MDRGVANSLAVRRSALFPVRVDRGIIFGRGRPVCRFVNLTLGHGDDLAGEVLKPLERRAFTLFGGGFIGPRHHTQITTRLNRSDPREQSNRWVA